MLTVTAETPLVDVVNNQQIFVASREVLDAIPTTRRDTTARALLIPGTTVTPFVLGQYNLTSHGSATSDFTMAIDGLRVNNLCGSGQYSGFYMNDAAVQELTYSTGSESAEIQSSGIRVNSVPKDGGNKFSGSFFVYGQGGALQSDNRTDAMKAIQANGLPLISIAGTAYDWQINPSFGGPIVKDKLWFYATYKYQKDKHYVPSSHFADGSPAFREGMGSYSGIGRVTWAASSKDKIRVYVEKQFTGEFYNGFVTLPTSTPEATSDAQGIGWIPQARWTRAQSSKLLFEAGIAEYNQTVLAGLQSGPAGHGPAEPERLDRPADRQVRLHDSAVREHDQGLQRDGVGQLRHRLARDEVRDHRPVGRELAHLRARRRHRHLDQDQRRRPGQRDPVPGRRLQLARDVDPERQQRLRQLRSGHLDDEAADAELRRAVRALQRVGAGRVVAGVHLDRRPELRGGPQRAELERLGGPLRRRLRPVRQRQDRDSKATPASTSRPRRPASPRRSTA